MFSEKVSKGFYTEGVKDKDNKIIIYQVFEYSEKVVSKKTIRDANIDEDILYF